MLFYAIDIYYYHYVVSASVSRSFTFLAYVVYKGSSLKESHAFHLASCPLPLIHAIRRKFLRVPPHQFQKFIAFQRERERETHISPPLMPLERIPGSNRRWKIAF